MKVIGQTFLIFLLVNFVYGQNLNGRFEGAVTRDGSVQLVNFDFYMEDGIQKGTYEIPENGSFDVHIDEIALINDTLNIKFYYGNFFCFISEDKASIAGVSEKWTPKIRLHVKKTIEKEKPYIKEEITFNNGEVTLSGMLYQPKNRTGQPVKYVILVHGSGAQDRFSPYYISLGYTLAKNGFGVLLYDKRGTGWSSGDFEISSMEDLADDAVAALNYLTKRDDIKISEIGFLGTSQGGWIAPLAANKSKQCDFLILNVGPSVSVFEQDINRVEYAMKNDGWDKLSIDSAVSYTKLYFQYAKDNSSKTWKNLDKFSKEIKSKNWVKYVNIPENKDDFEWWRINNYNPEMTLKNLKCRTLCLFGEFDPLVPPNENEIKMKNYLSHADIEYDIIVIKGTMHDMRTYQGINGEDWDWPKVYWEWRIQPVSFMNSIVDFLIEN
jgi:uncharacterized protein